MRYATYAKVQHKGRVVGRSFRSGTVSASNAQSALIKARRADANYNRRISKLSHGRGQFRVKTQGVRRV